MAKMAWAENAVIVKDNGSQVTYHPRCNSCGHVQNMITSTAYVRAGITNVGSFSCPKCKASCNCRFGRD